MSEEKLVPKLRFSGFTDEWNEVTLNDVATFSKGKGISKNDISNYGIECVRYGELYTKYNEMIYNIESKTDLDKNELKLSEKNDILIPCSGETAIDLATASCIQKDQVAIGGDITVIKTNQYAPFITYYLNQKKTEIAKYAQGVSIVHLYPKDFKVMNIRIPSINEQKMIIRLLEEITKKEQLLESKYQQYQEFKKYLMQQIFTQKLRFKSADGEQYSDWKERNLYEFLTEHKLKSTGNEEVYSVSVHKGLVNQKEHLGRDFSAPDTSKYNLVKPGDIVYTKSPTGDFPLGIIKQSRVDKNVIVSPLYGVFTPETYALGYILNDYFESNVNTHNYLHPIVQKGAKNTMNITNKTFLSKTLFVPTDVNEQQKIAECFSKVNDSIRNIEIQQNKVNEFKKGLLQQMFVVQLILSLLQNKKHI